MGVSLQGGSRELRTVDFLDTTGYTYVSEATADYVEGPFF